ncbi:MAG: arylesterase [Pseudomonadota bacterium]
MQRIFTLCLILLITACSGDEGPRLNTLPHDAVILAFGDSLTYGTGTTEESSYPAMLEQLSGRQVINAGIPGELSAGGLARLADTLEEHQPQLLILCLGGNDMLRQKSVQEVEKNLEEMVTISRELGVPVLLLGVPRPAIFSLQSAPFYYTLADRLQLLLEAEIIPEVLSDRELRSDQIHPNTEGYRLLARAVFNKLKDSGAL